LTRTRRKSRHNLSVRGVDFDFATLIFDQEHGPVEWPDRRLNYGEDRVIALGEINGLVLVVVYTDRPGVRRIISARRANRKERDLWQSFARP
jgi:uncharacterized DUF497 family protein